MSNFEEKKFKEINLGKEFVSHGLRFRKVNPEEVIRDIPGAVPRKFGQEEDVFINKEL